MNPYPLPPLGLLNKGVGLNQWPPTSKIGRRLVSILEDFGVSTRAEEVITGPVLVTYKLRLLNGTRFRSLVSLSNDIALALEVDSVRVTRIANTHLVGIEVNRQDRALVTINEILGHESFYANLHPLTVALGTTVEGVPLTMNLAETPHLLVAGATGTGKSIWLNSMLVSLLYGTCPSQVQLVLIDPKQVELEPYKDVPHLRYGEIITSASFSKTILQDLLIELDERYSLMRTVGERNLIGYNKSARRQGPPLSYIVIVIDEFADLILVNKSIERIIVRIAQLGRAAGVHLIISTQRPSVTVVTGLIKANIPTRLAFKTSSSIDSRVILDTVGAERLLGNGDALIRPAKNTELVRLHGAFITTEEVERVVKYVVENDAVYMKSFEGGVDAKEIGSEGERARLHDA